jgi:hypothetical protein
MDDPTRRCENDTDNGTRLLGAPGPKREPQFFELIVRTLQPRTATKINPQRCHLLIMLG